jgi:hypothetical protein
VAKPTARAVILAVLPANPDEWINDEDFRRRVLRVKPTKLFNYQVAGAIVWLVVRRKIRVLDAAHLHLDGPGDTQYIARARRG